MNDEVHFNDVAITGDVNSTPVVTLLNGIAVGKDATQRVGDVVLMHDCLIRLQITNEAALNDRLTPMRLILVYDLQTNGAALTTTDVLDAVTLESQINWDNKERFIILHDEIFDLNTWGGPVTTANAYHWVWNRVFQIDEICYYKGGTAAIGDIARGSLYLIYFGPDAAAAGDYDVTGTSRLLFQ